MLPVKVSYEAGKVVLFATYQQKDRCKSVLSGTWSSRKKCWLFSEEALFWIDAMFFDVEIDYDEYCTEALNEQRHAYTMLFNIKNGYYDDKFGDPVLMLHQWKCTMIAALFNKFPFYMDTGTGKTLTALAIMDQQKDATYMVVCPKAIIKSAWLEDQDKFYPNMALLPLSKNMKAKDYLALLETWIERKVAPKPQRMYKMSRAKLLAHMMLYADHYVINPQMFKRLEFEDGVPINWGTKDGTDLEVSLPCGTNGIIFDESAILKNAQSDISKCMYKVSQHMKYVYLLSGKPAPNNEMEYFSQMRVVDDTLFGKSYYKFREFFFEQHGWLPAHMQAYRPWRLCEEKSDAFFGRLSHKTYFIRKEDCLDLPAKTYDKRIFELSPAARKQYELFEKQQLLILEDEVIAAAIKVSALMKLRQMSSGFVYSSEHEGKVIPIHMDKIKALAELLDELGEVQLIIWVQFKPEIAMIEELLLKRKATYVTAYSKTKDVDESISQFKNRKVQYIIAHPRTLQYGATFTNCTYALYYSMSHSYEEYYQSHDRIYRKGQTKPCTYLFLVADDTIDSTVRQAVTNKDTNATMIENILRERRK